jgi:NADH-quinone oxidoreductase subunit N
MTFLNAYAPLFPELVLAVGAMALLMLGVFMRDDETTGETIGWLAVALIVAVGWMIVRQGEGTARLFDGAFVVDGFGRFMKLLVLAGSAVALLLSFDYLRDAKSMKFEFPVLILLATVGMLMMVSAGDLISLYLGLELQSLALYVIAAFRRDDVRSSEAGLKYFVLGALSSGMLLYGASLIYGFTGSTNFQVIASVAKGQAAAQNVGLIIGLVFLLVGLAFKISAVPFHMWTPDVYQGAPTPVTAFFAAAPKMAAMALTVRVLATAFPGFAAQWQQIIVFLALASMLLGAFGAIGQTNIKRMMAYSSIANIGFALVGLAANNVEGLQGVLVYLAIYLVMTLGAFACILCMRRDSGPVEDINELAGLARNNLGMAAALGLLMFSLAGIPPLAGFWGKWYVFLAAVKANMWALAVIGVIASVIGAYYYLRIVKIMFFDDAAAPFSASPIKARIVYGLAALLMLGFSITFIGEPVVRAAAAAAKTLM